jgi:acyl-CoA hydrolase
MVAPGIAKLVEAGIVNGSKKSIHRGKAIANAWSGSDPADLEIIDDNPAFELYDPEYVLDIGVIRSNHKQTSINNALSIDLTGQINSETVIGARMINGTGGQPETHIGAFMSKGGRAITLLQSTALNGAMSRIPSCNRKRSVCSDKHGLGLKDDSCYLWQRLSHYGTHMQT